MKPVTENNNETTTTTTITPPVKKDVSDLNNKLVKDQKNISNRLPQKSEGLPNNYKNSYNSNNHTAEKLKSMVTTLDSMREREMHQATQQEQPRLVKITQDDLNGVKTDSGYTPFQKFYQNVIAGDLGVGYGSNVLWSVIAGVIGMASFFVTRNFLKLGFFYCCIISLAMIIAFVVISTRALKRKHDERLLHGLIENDHQVNFSENLINRDHVRAKRLNYITANAK